MRLSYHAALAAALASALAISARAEDAPPGSTEAAGAAAVTTGSIDTGAAAEPLAAVGRSLRETLTPPPAPPDAPAAEAPALTRSTKPPTPEEAAELSEQRDRAAIVDFYASHNDAPLWVDKTGLTGKARAVIAEIGRAADWGLQAKDFDVPQMTASPAGAQLADSELARLELQMALAVMKYARFARGGAIAKPPRQLSSYYDRWPQVKDRMTVLAGIAAAADPAAYLVSLHPQHDQFRKLHHAWLEARRSAAVKAVRIPDGPDLKPGERHAHIALLRKRLEAPAETAADEDLYDARLARFLIGIQTFRGLARTDGTLDAETRAALTKPVKANAEQLLANMQAWRFLPEDMGQMHVWVNVPEYLIRIVKDGQVVWTERITAGLVNKQTPIFSDEMVRVTFKSRWRVPDSIKVREVWPSLLRGGGLMRQHGLIMQDKDGAEVDWRKIDWSKADMEDYTLWQPPGPKNQLGAVKFSFPSKHFVYMHDTPDKYMFAWKRRANSHGCMRVRNPLDMATIVLGADKRWDRAQIDDLVKNGPEHNEIDLEKKIPVHITYYTAAIGKDGAIETWPDVYGHEKRIRQALAGKWTQIAVPPDHLAPLDQSAVPKVAASRRKTAPVDDSVQSLMSAAMGGF